MKQKILDILQDYFADEQMVKEITEVLDKYYEEVMIQTEGDAMGFTSGINYLPGAVSLLDTGQLKQQDIRDWATLHGYAMVKCTSIADRLKVEKVAREIWGADGKGDKYFLE
jgi:hypothetical protein